MRDRYGRNTFGQSCLLARRLIEAGTRVVEVIWPKVANSDNHSWDDHVDLTKRMKTQSGPMLDQGLAALSPTWTNAGCSRKLSWLRSASSGAARRKGSALPATATAPMAAITGPIATPRLSPAPALNAAMSTANPIRPAAAPPRIPIHPMELLATIYHAFGIDPDTIVYNHLKQPRELVKAKAVTKLFV